VRDKDDVIFGSSSEDLWTPDQDQTIDDWFRMEQGAEEKTAVEVEDKGAGE